MWHFDDHAHCEALSSMFRGSLCAQFDSRPARSLEPGSSVYHLGDRAQSIYLLRGGLVKITALSESGKEIILNVHKPGEVFGEFCLCDGVRSESAVAMEPVELVEITLGDLVAHLQGNQDAMYNFLVTVCERLSRAYDAIQEMAFDSLQRRLVKTLLRLADDFGTDGEGGTEIGHYLTQEELAQMLSARREVVSTVMARLRRRGLVEYSRGGKLTLDRPGLEALLAGDAAAVDAVAVRQR